MKKILIDLDVCSQCEECGMLCSYIQHPSNDGITSLRELAHFTAICRKCDDAPCVSACPWEALEMQPSGVLKRHMMRCTSCKSCSGACPFGTIYPETIPFIISKCDYCLGRLKDNESPICLESCTPGGIRYGEFEENTAEGFYKISEHLIVKTSQKWDRIEQPIPKKK